jgi:hypothetical protein
MVRRIIVFLLTVLFVTILVAAAGSQVTLDALGVPVTVMDRLTAAGRDIVGAGPLLLMFIAPALLVTMLIAGFALHSATFRRFLVYSLAGAGAVLLVLGALAIAFPMPVLAAARTVAGAQMLVLAGAIGGLLYAVLGPRAPAKG